MVRILSSAGRVALLELPQSETFTMFRSCLQGNHLSDFDFDTRTSQYVPGEMRISCDGCLFSATCIIYHSDYERGHVCRSLVPGRAR